MTSEELQVQQKRELEQKQEGTVPARAFIPNADIYETEQALMVLLEMPGVEKSNVDINVEDDVLDVEGRIDFSKYQGLSPIYTEYPVGHYRRSFSLSNRIDRPAQDQRRNDGWGADHHAAQSRGSQAQTHRHRRLGTWGECQAPGGGIWQALRAGATRSRTPRGTRGLTWIGEPTHSTA